MALTLAHTSHPNGVGQNDEYRDDNASKIEYAITVLQALTMWIYRGILIQENKREMI
jgi:hypothetical protein